MAHSLAAPNHSKLRLSSVLFASPTRRNYNIMIPYHLINMTSPRIHMNRSRARLVRAMQSPGSNSAEPTPDNIPAKVMNLNYTSGPGLPKFSLLNFPAWLQWILGTIIFVALPTYKRFLTIEDQIDKTAETVVEMVEKAAETTEKISSEIAEAVPEDSKLKKIALKVEQVAEEVIKDAELVDSVIDKVDDFVDEVDAMVEPIIKGIEVLNPEESHEQKGT